MFFGSLGNSFSDCCCPRLDHRWIYLILCYIDPGRDNDLFGFARMRIDYLFYLAGCWLLAVGCWLLAGWRAAGWLLDGCWLAGPAGWLAGLKGSPIILREFIEVVWSFNSLKNGPRVGWSVFSGKKATVRQPRQPHRGL